MMGDKQISFCTGGVRVIFVGEVMRKNANDMLPLFEKIIPVVIQRFLALPADVLTP
jgi:hypothetical protein